MELNEELFDRIKALEARTAALEQLCELQQESLHLLGDGLKIHHTALERLQKAVLVSRGLASSVN